MLPWIDFGETLLVLITVRASMVETAEGVAIV